MDYGIVKKYKVKSGDVELDAWQGDIDAPILGNFQNMQGKIWLIPTSPQEREKIKADMEAAGNGEKRISDFQIEFSPRSARGVKVKLGHAYYNEDKHGNYNIGLDMRHGTFPRGRAFMKLYAYFGGSTACMIDDNTVEAEFRLPAEGGGNQSQNLF